MKQIYDILTVTKGKRNLTISENEKGIGCRLSRVSFGIDILDGLVEQLNWEIEYINQDGLSIRLVF
jgi:two-component sensor histidine kinase